MATPSPKSQSISDFLEGLAGRTSAITSDRCVDPPFGCGGPAELFRDDLSEREYAISGLCQSCQDQTFGS